MDLTWLYFVLYHLENSTSVIFSHTANVVASILFNHESGVSKTLFSSLVFSYISSALVTDNYLCLNPDELITLSFTTELL